jgi:hypothetical protein
MSKQSKNVRTMKCKQKSGFIRFWSTHLNAKYYRKAYIMLKALRLTIDFSGRVQI